MLRKVHNKGQIVIPARVRKQLGIQVGDVLEVEVVPGESKIELRVPMRGRARELAGSLGEYARSRPFPSRGRISEALRQGLLGDG